MIQRRTLSRPSTIHSRLLSSRLGIYYTYSSPPSTLTSRSRKFGEDMLRRDFWESGGLGKEARCPTPGWTTWSDPGEDIPMEGAPTSQVAVDRFVFRQKRNLPRWAVTCHGARSAMLRGASGCGIERPPPSHNDLGLHLHRPQPLVLGVFVEGSDVTDNARFSVC